MFSGYAQHINDHFMCQLVLGSISGSRREREDDCAMLAHEKVCNFGDEHVWRPLIAWNGHISYFSGIRYWYEPNCRHLLSAIYPRWWSVFSSWTTCYLILRGIQIRLQKPKVQWPVALADFGIGRSPCITILIQSEMGQLRDNGSFTGWEDRYLQSKEKLFL